MFYACKLCWLCQTCLAGYIYENVFWMESKCIRLSKGKVQIQIYTAILPYLYVLLHVDKGKENILKSKYWSYSTMHKQTCIVHPPLLSLLLPSLFPSPKEKKILYFLWQKMLHNFLLILYTIHFFFSPDKIQNDFSWKSIGELRLSWS